MVYPYSLNKEFGKSGKKGTGAMFVRFFHSLQREIHVDIDKISGKSFLHKLNQQLFNNLPNVMKTFKSVKTLESVSN